MGIISITCSLVHNIDSDCFSPCLLISVHDHDAGEHLYSPQQNDQQSAHRYQYAPNLGGEKPNTVVVPTKVSRIIEYLQLKTNCSCFSVKINSLQQKQLCESKSEGTSLCNKNNIFKVPYYYMQLIRWMVWG